MSVTSVETPVASSTTAPPNADLIARFLDGEVDSTALGQPPFGPLGRIVYERTYSRDIYVRAADGHFETDERGQHTPQPWWVWPAPADKDRMKENWAESVRRIVTGNVSLDQSLTPAQRTAEAVELFDAMFNLRLTPAGRHLWVTGTGSPWTRNCWSAGFGARTSDHFRFGASRLFEGGGVGSNYSHDQMAATSPVLGEIRLWVACDAEHVDYPKVAAAAASTGDQLQMSSLVDPDTLGYETIRVRDSREGWVDAWCALIDKASTPGTHLIVLDVSDVRAYGAPLRTFGGTASGPAPLVEASLGIIGVLNAAASGQRRLTGMEAMTMDHYVAAAVVAGGARRSARMSLMSWDSPEIFDFIGCKTDYISHWSTNISVEIDGRFRQAVADPDHPMHMHATEVLNAACIGMAANGEPGFVDTGIINQTRDRNRGNDVRHVNPCLTGDTWVQTTNGLRQVKSLVGGGVVEMLVDDEGHKTTAEGFFSTGVQDIVKIDVDGTILRCTPKHLISTPDGWRQAGDLVPGDQVTLTDTKAANWGGEGNFSEGYLLGALVGDGYFAPANSNGVPGAAVLCAWTTDHSGNDIQKAVLRHIKSAGLTHRNDWTGWQTSTSSDRLTLASVAIRDLAARFGIEHGNKTVTPQVLEASSNFQAGFLRGLFDADGHVEGDSKRGGLSVRLSQSESAMLGNVRTMLLALGIRSVVRGIHPKRTRSMPGGVYEAAESFRLVITGTAVTNFMERIGFASAVKSAKVTGGLDSMTRGFYRKPMVGVVKSVTADGTEEVYDAQVPGINAFVANGVVVHNCGEATLETTEGDDELYGSGESCNLGSVNLDAYGTDYAGAKRAFELVARFLYRSTFKPYGDKTAARIEEVNRRIGAGFYGFQGWCAAHGVKMSDFPTNPELMDQMTAFRDAAYNAACAVADANGTPRPISATAIAPTGSIAQLSGATSGINPVYSPYFIRRVRFADTQTEWQEASAAGYVVEKDMYADNTMTVEYPTKDAILDKYDEELIEGSFDIGFGAYMRIVAAVQATFCGGERGQAVSHTAQLAEGTEADELADGVLSVLGKVKGITAFPALSRPQSPLEAISKEDFIEYTRFRAAQVGDSSDGECANGACPVK